MISIIITGYEPAIIQGGGPWWWQEWPWPAHFFGAHMALLMFTACSDDTVGGRFNMYERVQLPHLKEAGANPADNGDTEWVHRRQTSLKLS